MTGYDCRLKAQDVEMPGNLLRSKGSSTSSSDGSKLSPQDTPQHGRYLDSSDGEDSKLSPHLAPHQHGRYLEVSSEQPKQYTLTSKERSSSSSILELVNMNGSSGNS